MKIRSVLLIVKRTAFTSMMTGRKSGDAHLRRLLDQRNAEVRAIRWAHEEHEASVEEVRRELEAVGIKTSERARMPTRPVRGFDLVVTVGGDGTLLEASHWVRDKTPLLGVNSAPATSVGFLTGCRGPTFARTLDELATGKLLPTSVRRLEVRVGRRRVAEPVLNDALFCHDNPAITTRYRLDWPRGAETQKSSGVWVSTPAGSTAALRSAGGPVLPIWAHQFGFVVREPYAPPGSAVRFRSGVVEQHGTLTLECHVTEASVFLDGSHRRYPVRFGEQVQFNLHRQPMLLVRPVAR